MKYFILLPLGLALLTTSCKTNSGGKNSVAKAGSTYQNNPYYGPSGSTYGSSTSDYSSTASSSAYPTYSESTYTPPAVTTPALPSVPAAPAYTGPASSGGYSAPAASNPYTSSGGSSSSSHTVAGGENLYRISLKHNTSVAAIKSANGLSSDTIHPGQTLRIP